MVLFGGTIALDLGVFVAALCVALYTYVTWGRNKWSRKGIPVSDPSFLLGNMGDVILQKKNMHETIREFYLKNRKKPLVTFFALTKPMVMFNDMELIKKVLIKDFNAFTDHHNGASPNERLAYWDLFSSKGDFWRSLRHKLAPTFTSGKMKRMFELIDACGREFVFHIERESDRHGNIDVKEAASRFTSDVIQSVAFGLEGDALKNKDSAFRYFMRRFLEQPPLEAMKTLLSFLYPSIIVKLDLRLIRPEIAEFTRKTVWNTVEYREKNNVRRNDFLDLMMQLRSKGSIEGENTDAAKGVGVPEKGGVEIDGDVFVAQCMLFMSAGFETSATTMTWALYELSLQPDLQNRAYDEIATVLSKHNGEVTYEAVQQMEYLHRVVQETIRKYPVLPFMDRTTVQPYKIPGTNITLDKGQGILIATPGIHHDPDIYPEPEKFDPERFTSENIQRRPPYSFLGFGEGPRICIGMRLGLLQAKVGLIYLLKNYAVKTCEHTPIPIVFDKNSLVPKSQADLTLRLEKRVR